MRRTVTGIAALLVLAGPLLAAPEGADLTLPRSTDRYIPGLISGEEAQVDRRMEVTEHEQPAAPEKPPQEKPTKPALDEEGEGFLASLFKDQTVINLIILGVLLGVFILYRLRSGGSRR